MGVLDELRKAVEGAFQAERDNPTCTPEDIIMDAIDAYEREHPGLVDHTERCARCGGPFNPYDPLNETYFVTCPECLERMK